MSQTLRFIALCAPMLLFLAGALAARHELWDALMFGALGLVSYVTVVRDLLKARRRGGEQFIPGEAYRRPGFVCGRCGCADLMYEATAGVPGFDGAQQHE